jgi:hypothetical protein
VRNTLRKKLLRLAEQLAGIGEFFLVALGNRLVGCNCLGHGFLPEGNWIENTSASILAEPDAQAREGQRVNRRRYSALPLAFASGFADSRHLCLALE